MSSEPLQATGVSVEIRADEFAKPDETVIEEGDETITRAILGRFF